MTNRRASLLTAVAADFLGRVLDVAASPAGRPPPPTPGPGDQFWTDAFPTPTT